MIREFIHYAKGRPISILKINDSPIGALRDQKGSFTTCETVAQLSSFGIEKRDERGGEHHRRIFPSRVSIDLPHQLVNPTLTAHGGALRERLHDLHKVPGGHSLPGHISDQQ